MNFEKLFDALDLDSDSELSRSELHGAARSLGWHWREAPLYAVLDRLTIEKSMSKELFIRTLTRMTEDPHGPYGRVLESVERLYPEPVTEGAGVTMGSESFDSRVEIGTLLGRSLGEAPLERFERFLEESGCPSFPVWMNEAALLIIDPQRSFTRGAWMSSFGPGAEAEVRPIEAVFRNCASLLTDLRDGVETMFTRCPFPPDSYDWDETLVDLLGSSQLYFVKPGNSVMWPPANGYRDWIDSVLSRGKTKLVMGGCTLNSCIRVSSIETLESVSSRGLEVIVDLSLSGARRGNYLPSFGYGGRTSVESAVTEMLEAGVKVVRKALWKGGEKAYRPSPK